MQKFYSRIAFAIYVGFALLAVGLLTLDLVAAEVIWSGP
jgi:hypothetical protein